jgi:dTDP-4-amino-4,6-dideoxygalactose transaminase
MAVPLIKPRPPRLSRHIAALRQIEDSGVFSNFGPVNTKLERDMVAQLFGGVGGCMAVCNATIGLMLAVQQAIRTRPTRRRYALMPSFTFAATAHAAIWCGLTPLFCDIDPLDWTPDGDSELRLLEQYGDDIAVIMPYATFGADIDLARYAALTVQFGVPVVVDAAASLGTIAANGSGFGTGFQGNVVFSMHATKSFATGEGGLIYSGNPDAVAELHQMANFGFGQPRIATMPGLNGKLSEIGALLAQLRLSEYDRVLAKRRRLMESYKRALPQLIFQGGEARSQAYQFASAVLPETISHRRAEFCAGLAARGIGCATYFSPHLAEQPFFQEHGVASDLAVTNDIANRMISLPIYDSMTRRDLAEVTSGVTQELHALAPRARLPRHRPHDVSVPAFAPPAFAPPAFASPAFTPAAKEAASLTSSMEAGNARNPNAANLTAMTLKESRKHAA